MRSSFSFRFCLPRGGIVVSIPAMLKRSFLLFAAFAVSGVFVSSAQSAAQKLPDAPAASGWQQVQALPAGTEVYLWANAAHVRCDVVNVSADSFTCNGLVLQRTKVETIKRPRRLVSTLAGAGIGAAVGIAIGAAVYRRGNPGTRGQTAAGGAVLFTPVGALVGYLTDFTRATVYRRSQ